MMLVIKTGAVHAFPEFTKLNSSTSFQRVVVNVLYLFMKCYKWHAMCTSHLETFPRVELDFVVTKDY